MLHPDIELKKVSDEIGYGVFATRRIPAGTITWVLDPLDRLLDADWAEGQHEQLAKIITRYTWPNQRGERIMCWDFARYMNHSCQPNTIGPGAVEVDIAIRDIETGEEVTCDYGALSIEESFRCLCGTSRCRGTINSDDIRELSPEWDRDIRVAFPRVLRVDQPLWPWVGANAGMLERWSNDPDSIPSVLARLTKPTAEETTRPGRR